MKIAFISRSTLHEIPGGDTIQVVETAKHLGELGVQCDILLTNEKIDYQKYDGFHFFNITRPSDILYHLKRINRPFAVSPILVDYSEYDRLHRRGFSGFILRHLSPGRCEYIKTISRWLKGKDILKSKSYLWKGHNRSVKEILRKAAILLPNSDEEYNYLKKLYSIERPYRNVPNGIDTGLFHPDETIPKDDKLVICVARIEGIKNQLNLIKAVNGSPYKVLLIGAPAPNQRAYLEQCIKIASGNIQFLGQLSQESLVRYYQQAKVHVLPSWFESCGLTSLEAAMMGCNIVITDRGFTREYYEDYSFYCDPADPASIFNAVEKAAKADHNEKLQQKILQKYTWQHTAAVTLEAYKQILAH